MDHRARREMIKRALNQKTARHLCYEDFLDLAKGLGCIGAEPRNDLGRPLFDGFSARLVGSMARERGLRRLGLSEVYPFNEWSDERANAVPRAHQLQGALRSRDMLPAHSNSSTPP